MFEEDFERCFMCQQPCKGFDRLYCSSECRLRDKGTLSPAVKAADGPIRLTAKLPIALSPLLRASPAVAPSPVFVPRRDGTSSSSSSISDSPINSPQTNPSATESPQKDAFNLPPPAYPGVPYGSVPVKIPSLAPRASISNATQVAASNGTVLPAGSIDTLRFGRKESVINSVTSPNALLARCACGKPANHRNRPTSRERAVTGDLDSTFSRFSLGPSVTTSVDPSTGARIFSEPTNAQQQINRSARSGYASPSFQPSEAALSTSLLSRSRSDPIPPSPKFNKRQGGANVAPMPTISPINTPDRALQPLANLSSNDDLGSIPRPPRAEPVQPALSPRRGRSRDRAVHRVEMTTPGTLLNREEREAAPSRSRHRRDELQRERARESRRDFECENMYYQSHIKQFERCEPSQITPSWSQQFVNDLTGVDAAVAMRRGASHSSIVSSSMVKTPGPILPVNSGRTIGPGVTNISSTSGNGNVEKGIGTTTSGSPSAVPIKPRSPETNREKERAEEMKRASEQLGQVFGLA